MTWWAWAKDWRCQMVTHDGVDVLNRCRGIFFHDDRPVALELFVRRHDAFVLLPPPRMPWEDGSIVTEIVGGDIVVGGLVRRAGAEIAREADG
jgi:hypothetical protein